MDETWEDFGDTCFNKKSDFPFPFQAVLVRFLDQRAPLPGKYYNILEMVEEVDRGGGGVDRGGGGG